MNRLLDTPRPPAAAVLVSGTTGLLGSLIAATLLSRTEARVVAPVRERHSDDDVWSIIKSELDRMDVTDAEALRERVIVTRLPATDALLDLVPLCKEHGVSEVVHAAGSVDYFKKNLLEEANILLTEGLLEVARQLGDARFVFISTAFSSGYRTDDIAETLHAEPEEDPTEYTASKRRAEHIVADSGVPFLILRPSVVMGDSTDGHYLGKPYGVYQFYGAGERLLVDKLHPELHVVAPYAPLQVVHQDTFCEGFFQACRFVADDGIVHLVSHADNLPTMRDLLLRGIKHVTPFERVYIYDRIEDVPLKTLTRRMRMVTEFAAVNTEIAVHPWRLATTTMDALRERGMAFVDASPDSVEVCLKWFIENSARFRAQKAKFPEAQSIVTEFIEVSPVAKVANG